MAAETPGGDSGSAQTLAPGTDGTTDELSVTDLIEERSAGEPDIAQRFDQVLGRAKESVPGDELLFDDEVVKENLGAVIVLLVWVRDGSHGKQLIDDVDTLFGTRVSPGTLYPALHGLNDDAILSQHERVRTKEYRIADEERGISIIAESFLQHLAFGYSLYWAHAEILDHGAD